MLELKAAPAPFNLRVFDILTKLLWYWVPCLTGVIQFAIVASLFKLLFGPISEVKSGKIVQDF